MRLNELRDNPNARKSRTRIGRGIGSGTVSYTHLTLPTKRIV